MKSNLPQKSRFYTNGGDSYIRKKNQVQMVEAPM